MALTHNQRLQRLFGGGFCERLWLGSISKVQLFLLNRHKDADVVKLLKRVRKEKRSLQTSYETYMVHAFALAYRDLPGEMAEVGVFQGVSAKVFCEAKGQKALHLFDTFEGLPAAAAADGKVHSLKQYACSLEAVQEYLRGYENVHFYKGLFPATAGPVEDKQFCFVHIDVDLYESTLACLKFFYPRLIRGGVLLSHDYSLLSGVRTAFDEFLKDKPEKPVEQPSTQCMLIKL